MLSSESKGTFLSIWHWEPSFKETTEIVKAQGQKLIKKKKEQQ